MGDPFSITMGILGLLPLCTEGFTIIQRTIKARSTLNDKLIRIEMHQGDFHSWQETWGNTAENREEAFTNYERRHPVSAREVLRQLGLFSRLFYDLTGLKNYGFSIRKSNKETPQDVSKYRFESAQDIQSTPWNDFHTQCRSNLSIWGHIKFVLKDANKDLEDLISRMRELNDVLWHHGPGVDVLRLDEAVYKRIHDIFSMNFKVYIDALSREASHASSPASQMRFRTREKMTTFQSRVQQQQQITEKVAKFDYSQFHYRSARTLGTKGLSELAILKRFPNDNQRRVVLIEWMENPHLEDRLRDTEKVALLLATTKPREMLVPHCYGIVVEENGQKIGIVLQPPAHIEGNFRQEGKIPRGVISKHRKPINLRELIANSREYCGAGLLALGTRFGIARKLATAVYMIHAARWVHKNIRSESILFFPTEEALQGNRNPPGNGPNFDFTKPIIVGFNNARAEPQSQNLKPGPIHTQSPDSSDEGSDASDYTDFSEDSMVRERATNMTFDYYQHPAKRISPKLKYTPMYDLYSLGCVLLEIGLWETIDQGLDLQTDTDEQAFKTTKRINSHALNTKLDGMTGSIYATAVRECLKLGEKSLEDPCHFGVELTLMLSQCSG